MTPLHSDKRLKGSVFELGESLEVLRSYDDRQVDLVVTSPPYFNQRTEYAEYNGLDDYLAAMGAIFNECFRMLRPGHIFACNIGQDVTVDLPAQLSSVIQGIGFSYIDTICWDKGGEIGTRGIFIQKGKYYPNYRWEPILIYRRPPRDMGNNVFEGEEFPSFDMSDLPYIDSNLRTNVWNVNPEKGSWHPAPYPLILPKNIIRCYTKRGDIVLDPFGGSGTTAVAAEELGRQYFLIERSKEYYDKAVQRINNRELTLL